MSLDLYVEYPSYCPNCNALLPGHGSEMWSGNITHNVVPMWKKAGVYDAFYLSNGHQPSEYIDALSCGLSDMETHFDEYKKLNAPNGWGTAEHAMKFLEEALTAFRKFPSLIIHVSR